MSSDDVAVANANASATTETAQISGGWDFKIVIENIKSAITQAQIFAQTELAKIEAQVKIALAQNEVDKHGIDMTYQAKADETAAKLEEIRTVETVQAKAELVSAQGDYEEKKGKGDKYEAQADNGGFASTADNNDCSYYYGNDSSSHNFTA